MISELEIPAAIEAAVQTFNRSITPFTADDVDQALNNACRDLIDLSDAERRGILSEILAFDLADGRLGGGSSPWGTYFCPHGSGTTDDGKTVYFPDIAPADAQTIAHWERRARELEHPVLKARYADLVWDLCGVIAGNRRNPEMARTAIDAYLAAQSETMLSETYDRVTSALRALDLAIIINDVHRIDAARAALLHLHREAMVQKSGPWSVAADRLMDDKRARLSDEERTQLVADLESMVAYFGDTTDPGRFNPHDLERAADRLIKHYARLRRPDDARRLKKAIGRAFEHFASLGNAMLASAVLQTAVNAYRDAGLADESKRVRTLMEARIGQSREEMGTFETKVEIPAETVEDFLNAIVEGNLGSTFMRIAANFLRKRGDLERAVEETREKAPLMAMMPAHVLADDHVTAIIGSVSDDPVGRVIRQATMDLQFSCGFLVAALERCVEVHQALPQHFVGWANRLGLFDDTTFLLEAVTAWYEQDLTKAMHVLVPQIERGLRAIVGQLGQPVTKRHPAIRDVSVAINMGDILYSQPITVALGSDLTLYFLALYADPRGLNLRNRLAHGQLDASLTRLVPLLIHTLLIFGVWKELAEGRR